MVSKTLMVSGNAGSLAIMTYGTSEDCMTNPTPYLSNLFFHTDLSYSSIKARVASATLNFTGVTRNYTSWDDGSKCGCFITTACVKYGQQNDDGDILNTLRYYRDVYMLADETLAAKVQEYYDTADSIVNALETKENASEVFTGFYKDYIIPAVKLIKSKQYPEALKVYTNLYNEAKRLAAQ